LPPVGRTHRPRPEGGAGGPCHGRAYRCHGATPRPPHHDP
jgi:hypothetical protein